MADYDIGQAFKEIEDELIASMIRNLERHKAWEEEEGFQWDQWQVRQLQALERYRRLNRKKFKGQFEKISRAVDDAIRAAREDGRSTAEAEILQKIKDGFADYHKADPGVSKQFFRLNERKLNALIKATKKDFVKGEHAILRMANDQYRKVIYAAQVYANTGAGTYEKAVDMATRDFLQAGLNCVEYKNGARHTLHDYADMAIRTATTRAYLAGEGEMRNEWGIHTVIVNKRTAACSKCMPFAGKIMIDDVYANGSRKDGPYMLVSTAIEKGFLHPRCKDTYSTYFPGLDDDKAGEPSKADKKKAAEKEEAEAKQNHAELQAEKYERMAEYSLDPENQRKYKDRAEEWKKSVQYMASDNNGNDWTKTISRVVEKQEMKSYRKIAKETNVNLADISAFDGDSELFIGSIQRLSELQIKYPLRRKLSLGISKILDDEDFAVKNNRTLLLNRVVLRNKTVTKDNIRRGRRFASRTYKDIVVHEYGHFMEEQFGRVTIDMVEKAMYNLDIKDNPLAYLYENISKYSISTDTRHNGSKYFKDLSSEILVIHERKPTEFTKEVFRMWTGGYYEKP